LFAVTLFQIAAIAAEKAEPPPTVTVRRGLLRVVVRAAGSVIPSTEVPVPARAAGEIVSLPIEIGQAVKKGQRLLEVESDASSRAVERADIALQEARANQRITQLRLADARRAFDRREADAPTSLTVEILRLEAALREAATSQALIGLEQARAELAKTRLLSPIDGVITEIAVRRGQYIAPGQVESGTPIITVSDLSKIAVAAEIEESQVRDVQPNLAATVVLPAFPERHFQGRITSIPPRAMTRGGKVGFPIRIELEGDPGDAARPGLTALFEIVAIEKSDALLLETRAIRWVGAEPGVVVFDQGQLKEVKVKLGRSDGVRCEVLEGLREGAQVVLPPPVAPLPTPAPPR
jgi:macrolide-specific efflux system membrane fusion protein